MTLYYSTHPGHLAACGTPAVAIAPTPGPVPIAKGLTAQGQRVVEQPRQQAAVAPMTAWTAIEVAARALIAKSLVPLTRQQAIAEVIECNPGLYRRYLDEGRGTAHPPAAVPVAKQASPAWTRIEAHAAAIVAKSQAPITRQQAIAQAMTQHPELYRQYNDERKGR